MTQRTASHAAALFLLAALPASASEGFAVRDLGTTADTRGCETASAGMFGLFQSSVSPEGGPFISTDFEGFDDDSGNLRQYDLHGDEEMDGIVLCRPGPEGRTQATLIVFKSPTSTRDHLDVAHTLARMWRETVERYGL